MRGLLVLLFALAAAGCGGDDEPAPRPDAVRLAIDAERAGGAGAPDAGTAAGHGADLAVTARGPSVRVTGRVAPADAIVRVNGPARGAEARANVGGDGRFAAEVDGLRPGANAVRVEAARRGMRGARRELRIVRMAPARGEGRVAVPTADRTPPDAVLRLRNGGRAVTAVAPVRRARGGALRLEDPVLDLEARVRDADGGTGRVRVSVRYAQDCGGRGRLVTGYFPPAEIARVRLPPGTLAPAQRRRRARLRLEPGGPGCVARGRAWADATNAHGLEAFSDPIRFAYRG